MKRTRWTPESPHKALRIALASASLLSMTAAPTIAHAAGTVDASPSTSGVYVTILSPNPGTDLAGAKNVEISAYYESSFGVSALDLFIDGKRMATQRLNTPETRGEISFVVDSAALRAGAHAIVVRATATDAEVASARTSLSMPSSSPSEGGFKIIDPATPTAPPAVDSSSVTKSGSADASGAPTIDIASPSTDSNVSGIVRIKVNASDPSGKSPYVSLFVDHAFKTLRNFPPYTFDWDTTRLSNGQHTIEVWGYNDAQQVAHAAPLKVNVNNPSGRTFERHDLSDTAPVAKKAIRSAKAVAARAEVKAARVKTAALTAKPQAATVKTAGAFTKKPTSLPVIAHTAKKTIVGLIAKADRLASANADTAPLNTLTQSNAAITAAPAHSLTPPPAPGRVVHTSSVVHKLNSSDVPSLRYPSASHLSAPAIATSGRTALTTENFGIAAKLEQMASANLGDLDTSGIASAIIAPDVLQREVPHLAGPLAAPQATHAPKHRFVPGSNPVVASISALNKIAASAAKLPNRLMQIASANLDQSSIVIGRDQITAPKLDIESVKTGAMKAAPAIARHRVTLAEMTPHDITHLRGAFQVVVDNQRLELNQPLQDRGSVLFAPLRQIFENQGGQLGWDQAKRQVRAVTPTHEVVVTIGSRKAVVNNQTVNMSGAPYLYNNRTMLPLDFFQNAMNAKVSYDAATGHLIIQSK